MTCKRRVKQVIIALVAVLLLLPIHKVSAQELPANYHNDLQLDAKAAIAIDSQSGQLLYGKNINQPLPIASMTKLVTAYLTLQAIQRKKITWQTKITPTPAIVKVAGNRDFSNVPLKAGHSYTVKQLYRATLIESANGAAMLLAEAVSGSQQAFVRQMREQLRKWQITDAKIYTTCGLPNKSVGSDAYPNADPDAENQMSARDMAIVGQRLLQDFPDVVQTTTIARRDFVDQNQRYPMTNFNWMLKGLPQYQPQLKVDGLKTGTTDAAGACFIATAKHEGARVITVVLGAAHKSPTDPARFVQTSHLLQYLYQNYRPLIFKPNEVITGLTKMKVKNGKQKQVNLGMKSASAIWLPVNGPKLQVELVNSSVEAPIKRGQIINAYQFKVGKQKLLSVQNPTGLRMPASSLQATDKVNIFVRFWRWLFGE
ncbi:D-alanyl-D-alanine carboxypeptidase [Lactobacillus sp. ESL0684]|uniref:D-alanyl-D-alanine carboxypeptidase family protein n=1 Tax=Lactobacillus sp. ESL0684 TaxID=2983213 RepID=UPI0023F97687|nr:D-alanyl-D-alanine carboxypeptidase family protein [Lactobacillus sp. ESL0684]WEV44188.1 D-alanyl-D-alanine carboxypeptidase [Lactobacillus sp. ESL0684]